LIKKRQDHEEPLAVNEWGWKFHHVGIPYTEPRENERFIEHLGMYVEGFDTSPYGYEWMRFAPDSKIDKLIQTVPHIAFEVDDIEEACRGKNVITEPHSIGEGIKVAMLLHNGAPIELLEFDNK